MADAKTEEKQEEQVEVVDTSVDETSEESQEETTEETNDNKESQEETSGSKEEKEPQKGPEEESDIIFVDGTYHILGRICSQISKRLMDGKRVNVVNCEKVVVSGKPKVVKDNFVKKIKRGDPYHGPRYPKYPDRIIRRTVRGMLPKNKTGRDALSRLNTFNSVPSTAEGREFIDFPELDGRNITNTNITTLEEIALHAGAKKKW